jgi:molybdate transport system ATP-binding protein
MTAATMGARSVVQAQIKIQHPGFTLDVDLALPGQGVSALFGPSGCGKTTTLRAIAGLERAPGARVVVNGEVWQDDALNIFKPVHQRPLGFVFQEPRLFAHLDVRGNLEYGLRRVPAAQRRVSLDQAVELLGIGHLLTRKPAALSGGEQQRVGMARALATSPRMLLMDEPLAALDAARKREVLPYLERLHRELDIPVLYVSHAIDEVARLADHLVLMEQGRVRASGPTAQVLTQLDLPVAHGEAASAVVQATIAGFDPDYQLLYADFDGGRFSLPYARDVENKLSVGQPVRLRIAARDVSLTLAHQQNTSILNILPGTVAELSPDGQSQVMVGLQINETRLLASVTRRSVDLLGLHVGQPLYVQIKGVALLG